MPELYTRTIKEAKSSSCQASTFYPSEPIISRCSSHRGKLKDYGIHRYPLGLYWDNGKENGNRHLVFIGFKVGIHRHPLGIYWDNGKENGNHHLGCTGFKVWGFGSRA